MRSATPAFAGDNPMSDEEFAAWQTTARNSATVAEIAQEVPKKSEAAWPLQLDWSRLISEGPPPDPEFIFAPHIAAGARILGVGPTESGKSFWAEWVSAQLSRQGRKVVYFSQENPLDEDLRRLALLQPDASRLAFYHQQGLDLAKRDHVEAVSAVSDGAALIVFDTLSSCWSGDEDSNAAIARLDQEALVPLIANEGRSVLLLDHTGHPQPFFQRRGVHAPRGASAKAQKADVVLEFRPEGMGAFLVETAKMRMGGRRPPTMRYRLVDGDGTVAFEVTEGGEDARILEAAEAMVAGVESAGYLTTRGMREAAKGCGNTTCQAAMEFLKAEDPPRLHVASEVVDGKRAKVWRPIGRDS